MALFLNYIDLKRITTERLETAKLCLRLQRGAFSGVLHAQTVTSKIAVLPQCEAFSADLTGRCSIYALRRAKITEGERVVPPVVALTRQVSVSNTCHGLSCEVAMFVCQVPQLSGFKLHGLFVCKPWQARC